MEPSQLQLDSFDSKFVILSNRRRRVYHVPCPQCGSPRWLQASDAKKAQICKPCQLADAHRANRLNNPSTLEVVTAQKFSEAGLSFRTEVPLSVEDSTLFIDIMVEYAGKQIAVECYDSDPMTSYWHNQPGQPQRDAAKRDELRRRGIPLVEILPIRVEMAATLVKSVATVHVEGIQWR